MASFHPLLDLIGRAIRGGWRPLTCYTCGLVLFINGVWLPLTSHQVIDWVAMTPYVSLLAGMMGLRTFEKTRPCQTSAPQ
jgi:hypothetical protein